MSDSVSVVLASFNGSNFIIEQVVSILKQLREDDELIILDDKSSDNTVELLRNIGDSRIKIYQNSINIGVIKTFEKAMALANGDYIFIADQDDIWLPGKYAQCLERLEQKNNVLVFSDVEYISDLIGTEVIPRKLSKNYKNSILRTLYSNPFMGCTMCFKKSILQVVIPIPRIAPMHDVWIGLTSMMIGEVYYIDKKLIQYRIHSSNASPKKRRTIYKVMISRLQLSLCFLILVIRIIKYRLGLNHRY